MRAKWLLPTITYPQHWEQLPAYSGHANTCWHLSYGHCYPPYLFLLLLGPTATNVTAYNNTVVKTVTWLEVRNLKSRHQKAVFPPKALQEIHSLPFPATRGHLHSLACDLFPVVTLDSVITPSDSPASLSEKPLWLYWAYRNTPELPPHLKIFNLTTPTKFLSPWEVRYSQVPGIMMWTLFWEEGGII